MLIHKITGLKVVINIIRQCMHRTFGIEKDHVMYILCILHSVCIKDTYPYTPQKACVINVLVDDVIHGTPSLRNPLPLQIPPQLD